MPGFLRAFYFDQTSFWLGVLAGLLLFWFFNRSRPQLLQYWEKINKLTKQARQGISASTEHRYRMDVLHSAQHAHLAETLFSLDEVLIEPHILAPPRTIIPENQENPTEIAGLIIPYLPDWPELGSIYGAPKITLAQALQGDANLILCGHPGIGKTVALAHLASLLARQSPQIKKFSNYLPVFVHAADINIGGTEVDRPLDLVIEAISKQVSTLTLPRLPGLLQQAFEDGEVVLLLDGLDEFPPKQIDRSVNFLHSLMRACPKIRVIVSAPVEYYDGLTRLGFIPIYMANWDRPQRRWFLQNWSDLWQRYTQSDNPVHEEEINPSVLSGWLLQENLALTPLELTLKVWSAYEGDVLGPQTNDAVEAYIRRIIQDNSKVRPAIEGLAYHVISTMQPIIESNKLPEGMVDSRANPAAERSTAPKGTKPENLNPIPIHKNFGEIVNSGLLIERYNSNFSFGHSTLAGYLASQFKQSLSNFTSILKQPEWSGKSITLQFLACEAGKASLLGDYLRKDPDPTYRHILNMGRWLRTSEREAAWRNPVMKNLAGLIQDPTLSNALRARAITALATSGEPGITTLCRKLLSHQDTSIRLIGVLGYGLIFEAQTVSELNQLLSDPTPVIRQAACLALVAIGTIPALESLAGALLNGEEDVQRTAAEALAQHPEEGYPILKDGSTHEDLLVRRAVVHGLVKVREPWAIEILERMRIEDGQWVVRNAADQAMELISRPNFYIPRPRPKLSETPWLIAFAGEHGLGISPGKPLEGLLIKALKEGKVDQRISALDRLGLLASADTLPTVYDTLFNSHGEVQEAAFNTVWQMAIAGVDLPTQNEFKSALLAHS